MFRGTIAVPTLWAAMIAGISCLPAAALESAPTGGMVWVVADFDGDRKPDLVSVRSWGDSDAVPGNEPRMHASPMGQGAFSVSAGIPTQRLRARDLDGDKDRDVVLENLFSVPLAVWINDGAGNFHRGNLDDYRFQLSQKDSQSFDCAILHFPSELTDDCPRGDAVPPPSDYLPAPTGAKPAQAFDLAIRGAVRSCLYTRGPPLCA
jgi:hypothetical protein